MCRKRPRYWGVSPAVSGWGLGLTGAVFATGFETTAEGDAVTPALGGGTVPVAGFGKVELPGGVPPGFV